MKKLFKPFYLLVVIIAILIVISLIKNDSMNLTYQGIVLIMIAIIIEDFGYYNKEDRIYISLSLPITVLILFACGPMEAILATCMYFSIIPLRHEKSGLVNCKSFSERYLKIVFNVSQGIINVYVSYILVEYLNINISNTLDVWKIIVVVIVYHYSNALLITLVISFNSGKLISYALTFKNNVKTIVYYLILTPILIYNFNDRGFLGLGLILIVVYSIQKSIITHRKWLKQEKELFLDGLTETYNYKYFQNIIDKKMKLKEKFTLMMIDLDDFKEINDTYGHIAGDYVLKNTVNIINNVISNNDKLCRYGGDEFCLIMNVNNCHTMVEKILYAIENSIFNYEGVDICVKASIGVYNFTGEDITKDELIKRADKAMYQVKKGDFPTKICYANE